MSHVTGGGLAANLARVLPASVAVDLDRGTWTPQAVFSTIQGLGRVDLADMERTFNMGIGMVLVVSPHFAESIVSQLSDAGVEAWRIGAVESAEATDARVVVR